MVGAAKILDAVKRNPSGIRFTDLVKLVEAAGFTFRRQAGSHRIYSRPGCPNINIQPAKAGKAKPYQVRQVLAIIDDYDLEV